VISERTVKLYEQHPPEARQGQQAPTLPELLHEVEVAAKFGTCVLIVADWNLAKIDWAYEAVRRQLTQQKTAVQSALQLLRGELGAPRVGVPPPPPPEAEAVEHLRPLTFGTAAAPLPRPQKEESGIIALDFRMLRDQGADDGSIE
jgi:hypothetical protein